MSVEAFFNVLFGTALGIILKAIHERYNSIKISKHISYTLIEEINKTIFFSGESPNFVHFSKQAFDNHFKDISNSFPEKLAKDIINYYWLMDYMENHKAITIPSSGGINTSYFDECKTLNKSLITRLEKYASHNLFCLLINNKE